MCPVPLHRLLEGLPAPAPETRLRHTGKESRCQLEPNDVSVLSSLGRPSKNYEDNYLPH